MIKLPIRQWMFFYLVLATAETTVDVREAAGESGPVVNQLVIANDDDGRHRQGPRGEGETIWFRIGFAGPVTVEGTPTLAVSVGRRTRLATYRYGGTSEDHFFGLQLDSSDRDPDGVSIAADPWRGGRVVANGTVAVPRLDRFIGVRFPSVRVDGRRSRAPIVEAVNIVSRPNLGHAYPLDGEIVVRLVFDKAVVVNPNRAPHLMLLIGGERREASWRPGSLPNMVDFAYRVQRGDQGDVVVARHALQVRGRDSIRDSRGNPADRDLRRHVVALHGVDGVRPSVELVGFVNEPEGGQWVAGDVVRVDIEFTEPVQVLPAGGAYARRLPELKLLLDEQVRWARWNPEGSIPPRMRFEYAFGESDHARKGVAGRDGIEGHGWTIADAAGNAANLALGRQEVAHHPDHQVDGAARVRDRPPGSARVVRSAAPLRRPPGPRAAAVEAAPDTARVAAVLVDGNHGGGAGAPFGRGQRLWIEVRMSQQVVVTGAPPTLELLIGARRRRATYSYGGASASLWFKYVIGVDDLDLDGLSIEALKPSRGGGIRTTNGRAVDLQLGAHAVVDDARYRIDGRVKREPRVQRVAITPAAGGGHTHRNGEQIRVSVVYPGAVTVSAAHPPTLALRIGQQVREATWVSSGGAHDTLDFVYTVTDLDDGDVTMEADGLVLPSGGAIRDEAGMPVDLNLRRHVVSDATTHRVDGRAPVLKELEIVSDPGPDRAYSAGDVVEWKARFSEPVEIRRPNAGRPPHLSLRVGEHVRKADVVPLRGAPDTVTFAYEVRRHDHGPIKAPANPLQDSERKITDRAGNPADVRHAPAINSDHAVSNIRLVRSDARVALRSEDDFSRAVVADEVLVDRPVTAGRPVVVVANRVVFQGDGRIASPQTVVLAQRVEDARVDAAGASARGRRGSNGQAGGAIFIGAERIEGASLDVSGGHGAPGVRGRRGRDGVDGRCTSWFGIFGRWRDATPGEAGGRGGRGGDGGDGGTITVVTALGAGRSLGEVDVAGGRPGDGGPGGLGGVGGQGCIPGGLHYATNWPEANGANGRDGPSGASGARGTVSVLDGFDIHKVGAALDQINLTEVAEIMETGRLLVLAPGVDADQGRRR